MQIVFLTVVHNQNIASLVPFLESDQILWFILQTFFILLQQCLMENAFFHFLAEFYLKLYLAMRYRQEVIHELIQDQN